MKVRKAGAYALLFIYRADATEHNQNNQNQSFAVG